MPRDPKSTLTKNKTFPIYYLLHIYLKPTILVVTNKKEYQLLKFTDMKMPNAIQYNKQN